MTVLVRNPLVGSDAGIETFRQDVLDGLRRPRKSIPFKYLYDERGSELFERICALPEYYLTRTEIAILRESGAAMAEALGRECLVVEYGTGSGIKTRMLLELLEDPVAYVPIDIATVALEGSALRLAQAFPDVEILPINADYTTPIVLPHPRRAARRCVVYYPGSSIGNFTPPEAVTFLERARAVAGAGGALLIGVDLEKDAALLEAAYDDSEGVTAAFTKNLLDRINRKLGGDIPVHLFRHCAAWNAAEGRIEIHLQAGAPLSFRVAEESFVMGRGERIHVEYAYKYDVNGFSRLAAAAGWMSRSVWTDPRQLFSVHYLVAPAAR